MNLEAIFAPVRDRPVGAALVGVGEFGATFVAQARRLPGLEVRVLCDRDPERARDALRRAGVAPEAIARGGDCAAAEAALARGRVLVTDDAELVAALPVDIVVEATGDPEAAARLAEAAIAGGKHVAMVTKEAEIVVGPILRRRAAAAGLVHTPVDGDQPSLLIGLVGWARLLGFEVLAAGKSSESDVVCDPEAGSLASWGERFAAPDHRALWSAGEAELPALVARRVRPGMITRTPPDLCEMGIVANATGLAVDRPELHAPIARTLELPALFRPREAGGLLARRGVVDMFNCLRRADELSFAGGVFVTVELPDARTGRLLAGKGLPTSADGRCLLLHNPVHLLGLEAPMSVLAATRLGVATGGLEVRPRLDLVARAVRALAPGERLALGARHAVAGLEPLLLEARPLVPEAPLPYYLAAGCRLARPVAAGELLTVAAVEPPAASALWRLRREQDAAFFAPA